MDDLYQQIILDHYKHPRNFRKIDTPSLVIDESNASCGDSFTFYIILETSLKGIQTIKEIAFIGTGCAISTAASSILTESLKGKAMKDDIPLDLNYMQSLIGVNISAGRHKCLMLPARAMHKALNCF